MNSPKRNATPRRKARQEPQQRLSRQDWIDGAVRKLAEDSVAALRVDELAEQLNVTKGSFYWHFETREDLLEAVLEWWRALMTTEIRTMVGPLPKSPWERISKLMRIAISPRPDVPGGPFELTLRDWARRDPHVAKVVREVDDARTAFVTDLYKDAGLDDETAQDYAIAQMAFVIGGRSVFSGENPAQLERRRRIAQALFLPKHLSKSGT